MDANSTSQAATTMVAAILHAGMMAHAEWTHRPYDRQRAMREQRIRDREEGSKK